MAKPKAIQWLEKQTGESIPYVPEERASEGRGRQGMKLVSFAIALIQPRFGSYPNIWRS